VLVALSLRVVYLFNFFMLLRNVVLQLFSIGSSESLMIKHVPAMTVIDFVSSRVLVFQ